MKGLLVVEELQLFCLLELERDLREFDLGS